MGNLLPPGGQTGIKGGPWDQPSLIPNPEMAWAAGSLGPTDCNEPTKTASPLPDSKFPFLSTNLESTEVREKRKEVPAKRMWEAKVFAPTSKAGNQVEEP